MNNQGWIHIAERLALRDIAQHQIKTIKDIRAKKKKGLLITAWWLYENGKLIRKQNREL